MVGHIDVADSLFASANAFQKIPRVTLAMVKMDLIGVKRFAHNLRRIRDQRIPIHRDPPVSADEASAAFPANRFTRIGLSIQDNPAGILVERDELISLLKHLDREEQVVARGFYLSGWSGRQSYSFDRIGRGHIHLDAVCLSVLGGTQPARIYEYMRHTHAGGAGGDGLIQRFGLMVWPDMPPDWRDVDRYPDQRARSTAQTVFDNAANLDLPEALKRFADKDQFDSVP